jgi:hypothetical protein
MRQSGRAPGALQVIEDRRTFSSRLRSPVTNQSQTAAYAIDVSSDCDVRVTEDLRDHFERHAGRQHDRGSRVPQSMQPNGRRQLGTLRRDLEGTQRIARIAWLAKLGCEGTGSAATSSQPAAAQPSAWCARRATDSLRWGRAALPGVTSLSSSPSRGARRQPGPRCHVPLAAWRQDQCRTSGGRALRLRKPLLTSSAKSGAYRLPSAAARSERT